VKAEHQALEVIFQKIFENFLLRQLYNKQWVTAPVKKIMCDGTCRVKNLCEGTCTVNIV